MCDQGEHAAAETPGPVPAAAATKIQAVFRGCLVRWFELDMDLYRFAARTIQRRWRHYVEDEPNDAAGSDIAVRYKDSTRNKAVALRAFV